MATAVKSHKRFRAELDTVPRGTMMWLTKSRRWVDPWALQMQDINLDDISLALSNVCRFQGHVETHLSVAEHSVNVAQMVKSITEKQVGVQCDSNMMMAGLLHDASEAYLGDIHGPSKQMPEFQWYRRIEHDLQDTILARFGVTMTDEIEELVHEADQRVFTLEWEERGGRLSAMQSQRAFTSLFNWLVRERLYGR